MTSKEVMTLSEAAEYLRVCRQTLRSYVTMGLVPCRKVGRNYLFSRLALLDWLAKMEPTPERGCGRKPEEL